MELFNRWLVTLLALALAAASAFILVAAGGLLRPDLVEPLAPALGTWVSQLQEIASPTVLAGALGGVVAAFGLIAMEWVVPDRARRVVIQRDELGCVTVSLPGLRRLANHVVGEVAGVETVTSEARPTRDGVAFQCRVVVKPDTNTPEMVQTIRERLDRAVRTHTGRPATQVHVHAQVGQSGLRKRVL